MDSPGFLGAAAFLALALFCAPARAAECQPLRALNTLRLLPIDNGNARLVPVVIDGTPRRLLLDTGGYVTQLSAFAVADLKLPLLDSPLRTVDVTGNMSLNRAQTREFILGSARSTGAQFQVAPNPEMGTAGVPFDGLLAGDQLLASDTEMDFGGETLTFFSPDHCAEAPLHRGALPMSEVPLRIENNSYIVTTVELDGHKLTALIDTGASGSAMGMVTAEHPFQLEPGGPGDTPVHSINGNPVTGAWRHKFSALSFGGLTIQDPGIIIMQAPQLPGEMPDGAGRSFFLDRWDIVIGMDMLRHLRLYIAPAQGKLYVAPASLPQTGR